MPRKSASPTNRSGVTLTFELASAAGRDAANALMRARRATKWSALEWNVAVAVTNRLCSQLHDGHLADILRTEADEVIEWLAQRGVVQKAPGVLSFRIAAWPPSH